MKRNRPSSALRRPTGEILLGLFALLAIAFTASAIPTQEVKHGIGQWDPESGLGNHRAVVRVEASPAPTPLPKARGAKKAAPPLTLTKPKPLLKVMNRTILEHHLEGLRGLVDAVVLVVRLLPQHALSEAEILGACRRALAGYMVPQRVIFRDDMPQNPNGKINRPQLAIDYAQLFVTAAD